MTDEVNKLYWFCAECGKLIIIDGYSSCNGDYILCEECEVKQMCSEKSNEENASNDRRNVENKNY